MKWSLLCMFCALLAGIRIEAATVTGRVFDTNHAPLPGVTVEAKSGTKSTLTVSNSGGSYAFDVPPGIYDITYRLISFALVSRKGVAVKEDVVLPAVSLALETNASIVVTGKRTFRNLTDLDMPVNSMIGVADAASVGVVTSAQIESRSEERPGDVLETIPGLMISQHSGEGKANQYYLRGFNLDHGTDFASTVAGVPVNMRTHAHGQGYSDNNFLIPELISGIQYKKGPYYADEGDFASAGAANVNYVNVLDRPIVSLSGGRFGYMRGLAAASTAVAGGELLGGVELSRNQGPWTRPDDYRKINGIARFTAGGSTDAYSVSLAAYNGRWNSTDQVPARAIHEGLISRFGNIDSSDGGLSHRYSLSADWQKSGANSLIRANGYVIDYALDLFSNFTYFLDDPVDGDQFEQADRRVVAGGRTTYQWFTPAFGRTLENLAGVDLRHDHIGQVGLYHTRDRVRLETVRSDRVLETSIAPFVQNTTQWTDKLRTVAGARFDTYWFDVQSIDASNSGRTSASIASPKLNIIFGPWSNTEFYVSGGYGFHSNDGRGTTLTREPGTGAPAERVTPLVRTAGAEIGTRSLAIHNLQTTVAFWGLDIASELVFSGDAGTTEASRPSRRRGIEWSNDYHLSNHVAIDADLAYSKARFTDRDPVGYRIPGALEGVISAGLSLDRIGPWSGSLRWRYLGPRPLIEDNGVRSQASHLITARVTYAITSRYHVSIDGLNLLNARVSDIDYYYTSRLPGEPSQGVDDVHTHPVEPRSVRVGVTLSF